MNECEFINKMYNKARRMRDGISDMPEYFYYKKHIKNPTYAVADSIVNTINQYKALSENQKKQYRNMFLGQLLKFNFNQL